MKYNLVDVEPRPAFKTFRLIDTNRYFLPGTNNRFLHVGSIHSGLKEFMCFLDTYKQQCHIEEITGGHLSRIDDDNLFDDLMAFVHEKKLIQIQAGASLEEQPFTANK